MADRKANRRQENPLEESLTSGRGRSIRMQFPGKEAQYGSKDNNYHRYGPFGW